MLQQSLKLEVKNALTLNNLGASLFYMKRLEEANKIFDQAIQ